MVNLKYKLNETYTVSSKVVGGHVFVSIWQPKQLPIVEYVTSDYTVKKDLWLSDLNDKDYTLQQLIDLGVISIEDLVEEEND